MLALAMVFMASSIILPVLILASPIPVYFVGGLDVMVTASTTLRMAGAICILSLIIWVACAVALGWDEYTRKMAEYRAKTRVSTWLTR